MVIVGSGFTGASDVSFGTVAAASFSVDTDTQITAVSPAEDPGVVDVVAATPGGTTPTGDADQFTHARESGVNSLAGCQATGQ